MNRHINEKLNNAQRRKAAVLFAMVLCLVLVATGLTGCGEYMKDNGKPLIVCTIYPEYDWLMNVLGDEADNYNIKLILDGSTDIHSYQPTAADIAAIASCDLLIYPGGESTVWIEDALEGKVNEDMRVIQLIECLGEDALNEHDHGEDEAGAEHDHHHSDEEIAYDEHVWLSLKNAEVFVHEISHALGEISPEKAGVFEENAHEYEEKLHELDEAFLQVVNEAEYNTLMFADRFAFRYMMEDYSIEHYEAFTGCSADAEAGFETVAYLAEKLNEEKLPAVVILENTDERLAETIIDTAEKPDTEILVLDSMQSITAEQKEEGYSYLSAMEYNLGVIKEALN